MIHYSQTTNAFYDDVIHADIPEDAVIITSEAHQSLLSGQSNGKIITSDGKGNPVLADLPPPSPEQVIAQENANARKYLADTDWYVIRKTETGEEIPLEVLQKRAAARLSITE